MERSRFQIVLVALLTGVFAGCGRAEPAAEVEQVRAKAQECADAMLGGNYAKVADLTHPKVVAEVGGKQKMVDALNKGVQQMKAQRFAITGYTVSAPGEVVGAGADRFAVVPTALEMKTPTGKLKQKSYLLGVSGDGGRSWTFVDGSELNEERLRTVAPNVPKELKLPAAEKPVIE